MTANLHVLRQDDQWVVKTEENGLAPVGARTQEEAIQIARQLAQEAGTDVVIHGKDGKVRAQLSLKGQRHSPDYVLRERIVASPDVLHGQPRIEGTRIPVSMILGLLAAGATSDKIISDEYYPSLTIEDVQACLAYARDRIETERYRLADPKRLSFRRKTQPLPEDL